MRFNNNPEALIFGSFHLGKEQRFYFKINHPRSPAFAMLGHL
jgi:hypothetical protein